MAGNTTNYTIKVGVLGDQKLQAFQRSVDKLNASAKANSRALGQMSKSFGALERVTKLAGSAIAVFYAAKGVTNLIAQADALRNLEASMSTLLGSGERASAMMREIFAVAKRTGAPLNDVASAAQRLAIGLGEMGASNAQITTITETFIKLGRVGGASMADVNGALIQFSQGLSSGRLQGDEFRSISERLPLVMRALAKELNVTVGELKQLGSEGKITSDVMANAMLKAAGDVNAEFAKLPLTFEQASNNFKTMLTGFLQSRIVVKTIDVLAAGFGRLTSTIEIFANTFTKIPIAVKKMEAEYNYSMAAILSASAGAVSKIVTIFDGLANALLVPINLLREFSGKSALTINAAGSAMEKLESSMQGFQRNGDAAAAAAENLARGLEASREELEGTLTASKNAGDLFKSLQASIEETKKRIDSFKASMSSAIEDGIINAAKGGKDAFKNMAESILEQMARMVIQAKILKPLMDVIFASGAGFFGGMFSSPAAASANGNYFPNGLSGKPMTAFATGGIISGRTRIGSNLLGENGPEMVAPLKRHNGRMGVAASPVNVNVINNAGAEVQVSETTGNDGSRTIDVMIESKMRNAFATGSMDKAMSSRFGMRPVGG